MAAVTTIPVEFRNPARIPYLGADARGPIITVTDRRILTSNMAGKRRIVAAGRAIADGVVTAWRLHGLSCPRSSLQAHCPREPDILGATFSIPSSLAHATSAMMLGFWSL